MDSEKRERMPPIPPDYKSLYAAKVWIHHYQLFVEPMAKQ